MNGTALFATVLACLLGLAVGSAWLRAVGKPCDPPAVGYVIDSGPLDRACVYVPARDPEFFVVRVHQDESGPRAHRSPPAGVLTR